MKCSLKNGFINILLIIFITPSEGVEFPLLLHTSSVIDKPMNFRQFRAALNRLQDMDSFPNDGDSGNKHHKIVKKQMAVSDCGEFRKNKRSVLSLPFGEGESIEVRDFGKSKKMMSNLELFKPNKYSRNSQQRDTEFFEDFMGKVTKFSKHKRSIFSKSAADSTQNNNKKEKAQTEKTVKSKVDTSQLKNEKPVKQQEAIKKQEAPDTTETIISECKEAQEKKAKKLEEKNKYFKKRYLRVPDKYDYRYYYEFESSLCGCMKLRHKRCPDGQFFSSRYLKCLKSSKCKRKKRHLNVQQFRKSISPINPPEEPDPSNEWLDATQGSKIPPEFKPVKKPELKIYHLYMDKDSKTFEEQNVLEGTDFSKLSKNQRKIKIVKSLVKRQEPKTRRAKSFLIRIHKKVGKDESVAENEENDDEDDENDESDDEDDEEDEGEDEDDEADDEITNITQKDEPSSKETLKEFIKSAKEAVTNRARFNENPIEPKIFQKNSPLKSKKSEQDGDSASNNKKVLIDANIKMDSTIGNALKCVLKSKAKGNQDLSTSMLNDDEALISDRGSQDQLDPELIRMYEHLLRHNPRVKRYFMANWAARRN